MVVVVAVVTTTTAIAIAIAVTFFLFHCCAGKYLGLLWLLLLDCSLLAQRGSNMWLGVQEVSELVGGGLTRNQEQQRCHRLK